jgi:hypothetical protein
MSQKSGRIDNDIQKSSRQLQGYTYVIQDSRHKPLLANNGNEINTISCHEKYHDRWASSNPPIKLQNKNFGTDAESNLTASSSQEVKIWDCSKGNLTWHQIQEL